MVSPEEWREQVNKALAGIPQKARNARRDAPSHLLAVAALRSCCCARDKVFNALQRRPRFRVRSPWIAGIDHCARRPLLREGNGFRVAASPLASLLIEGLRVPDRVTFVSSASLRPGNNHVLLRSTGRRASWQGNPKVLPRLRTSVGRSVLPDRDRAKRSFASSRPCALLSQRCRVHATSARECSAPACLSPRNNRVLTPSNGRRVTVDARCDACRIGNRSLCLSSTLSWCLCVADTVNHDLLLPVQGPVPQRIRDP